LPRPALSARLREALDYRLIVVQAGTGYGKSTALAALGEAEPPIPCAWYSVSEDDADPRRFVSYLVEAARVCLPHLSESPLAILQELSREGNSGAWSQVVDALVNALAEAVREPLLFVVDDYHFIAHSPEVKALVERFIAYLPPQVHLLLATRYPLHSPNLTAWRAKGELLEFGQADLIFQPAEIEALFRTTYGLQLAPEDMAALVHKTEGWPIALQLVWQGLRQGAARRAAEVLAASPSQTSLNALFDYLAHDVLDRQPPDIAAFLCDTAVLRELTPAACDAVTRSFDGAAMLQRLHELGLFVVALGERHYRYHHLFHDFLRERLATEPAHVAELHRRAAGYFQARRDHEEAIYHWLAARAFPEAAAAIEAASEAALHSGQLDTVARWIDALPPETLAERPRLHVYLGDIYRLRSHFEEALAWYAQAERAWRARGDPVGISRALRGQALVYLDTVHPVQAESLLQEALRLTDGLADREARARMLELVAENKLNLGKPNEAERLRGEARALREEGPGEDVLSVRVKLRTGQLDEAQRTLGEWVEAERHAAERGQAHPPRSHRETVLILSLIHSLRGQTEQAFALAQEGIALGEKLDSPFITAVSHTRLGHAWQLRYDWPQDHQLARDEAIRCYQSAIALGDRLAVRRMRAEAMWGLTRAYGFFGDLESAQRAAAEGMEIGRWAGDVWITALIEVTLGASHILAGQPGAAIEILTRALNAFRECGDSFGRAASRLWLSLAYFDLRQGEHFASCVEDLLSLSEAHKYPFLLTTPSLLGPPDPRRLVPLLIEAQVRRKRPLYVAGRLADLGLPAVQVHPGYQLRVRALGGFHVWRGAVEVDPREWKRDKARQLFQLLLTCRGQALQREAITEKLWPDLSPEAAGRDFKVALNALNKVLEPTRSPDAPSAYILREGAAYGLRPEADLWLDAALFERESEAGLRGLESSRGGPASAAALDEALRHLQSAIQLYAGDYLPEALYEDWATTERERLAALFLRTADRLAGLLIERGELDEGLKACELILSRDPCWESAYRLMMAAYARQGNRPQALKVYQRCVNVLREELAVDPSPATVAAYHRLAHPGQSVALEV
jgi:ATP/maltotriose-dependent transcriptional regulator MalT/DNA-binding SARP family transcriptional activator